MNPGAVAWVAVTVVVDMVAVGVTIANLIITGAILEVVGATMILAIKKNSSSYFEPMQAGNFRGRSYALILRIIFFLSILPFLASPCVHLSKALLWPPQGIQGQA